MKTWTRPRTTITFAALTACLTLSVPQSSLAQPPAPDGRGGDRGARFAQDPRAQARTYHFEDTNEDLPYSVYVSTKVKPDEKAPLIVNLRGLGAPLTIMMGKAAVDLAEEGGYILVAPMGYNIAAGTVVRPSSAVARAEATALRAPQRPPISPRMCTNSAKRT